MSEPPEHGEAEQVGRTPQERGFEPKAHPPEGRHLGRKRGHEKRALQGGEGGNDGKHDRDTRIGRAGRLFRGAPAEGEPAQADLDARQNPRNGRPRPSHAPSMRREEGAEQKRRRSEDNARIDRRPCSCGIRTGGEKNGEVIEDEERRDDAECEGALRLVEELGVPARV